MKTNTRPDPSEASPFVDDIEELIQVVEQLVG
jgi:hypothetical protein